MINTMPISKENRKLYPKNWTREIVPRILKRAGFKCEKCGLHQYSVGYRDQDGRFVPNGGSGPCDASGWGRRWPSLEPLTYGEARDFADHYNDHGSGKRQMDCEGNRWIVVVLTVAHLVEGGPLDCPDEELAALCQACHNRLDAPMRARNRKRRAEVLQHVLGYAGGE